MKFKYFVLRNSDPVRLAVDIDGLLLTDKLKQIIQKLSPTTLTFPEFESVRTDRTWFVSRLISRRMLILRFFSETGRTIPISLGFDIYPATQKIL